MGFDLSKLYYRILFNSKDARRELSQRDDSHLEQNLPLESVGATVFVCLFVCFLIQNMCYLAFPRWSSG